MRVLLVLLGVAGPLLAQRPPVAATPSAVSPGDWSSPARDPAGTRFSPLTEIKPENVTNLRVAWTFATGSVRGHEGNPLVVGRRMYLHTPHPVTVYAFDLEQPGSAPLWRYAPPARDPAPFVCCDGSARGIAWHPSGKLYVPLVPGDLAAIDANTGKEIWRVRNGNPVAGITMPSAPLVIGDVVVVGVGGAEFGARGYLSGYDAASGKLLWKAFSTGSDADVLLDGPGNTSNQAGADLGLSTWTADAWQRGGGATWGWLTYDPESNLLFHGTGGAAPLNPLQRAGDNKWTSSVFARDPVTGRARWALQLTPRSGFSYDASNESHLVDLTVQGRAVKALVHFDHNGFVYTIDRMTGRIVTAEKYGPANWARNIEVANGAPVVEQAWAVAPGQPLRGVCPSIMGIKGHQPAAYSPTLGLFFVPLSNVCMDYTVEAATFAAGKPFLGATIKLTPGPGGNRGRFIAWNAAQSTLAWEIREPFPVLGGALATASGLVFYGTLDGWLKAADARNGSVLWKFRTPSGIIGSPITYAGPDGRQYLAIVSGVGGWAGPAYARAASRTAPDLYGVTPMLNDLPAVVNPGGVLMVFSLP